VNSEKAKELKIESIIDHSASAFIGRSPFVQFFGEKCFFENPWDKPKYGCKALIRNDLFVPRGGGTSVGQAGTNSTNTDAKKYGSEQYRSMVVAI